MITKVYKHTHEIKPSGLSQSTRFVTYYFLDIPFWKIKIVFPEGAGTF